MTDKILWFVKFIQKRPSDKIIQYWRIIFWLILSWSLYYNFFLEQNPNQLESNFLFIEISKENLEYIKYFFIWLWIIPISLWITNLCILKKKYMRIVQIIFAVILFYISNKIISSPSLDIDTLILIMWIILLIAWITWKCISSKCLKFKEKITKIRV